MTDKQIIDCEYFKTGEIKFCTALNISFYNDFICNKGDCIILKLKEQLKAKEQECERLEEELYYWVNGEYCDNECNVVKELDQLKKQHEADKGLITSTGKMNYQLLQEYDKLKTENNNIKETFDGLFKVQYKLADNNKKLRQCLTEIKEITEEWEGAESAYMVSSLILQKISEVENETINN